MSSANVGVHLHRDNGAIPWGFRMQGGRDFGSPLVISKVSAGSVASQCGLLPGDLLIQINGVHTGLMLHEQAQQAIIASGNRVTFGIERHLAKPVGATLNPYELAQKTDQMAISNRSTSPAASKKEKEKSRSVKSPENKTPKPWVPSDRPAPKMSEIPCGDDTATKSTSMLYNSAPQDPQKVPYCSKCNAAIRGPFILALNKCWCPSHFTCSKCGTELINMGFVELNNQIYCENDYEAFFAPKCAKCHKSIIGDTVNALNKTWHPACFLCVECSAPITHGAFHVEDGKPYCMKDWQRMFQTKCKACNFPVEAGDRWIEAMDSNWHAECFVCQVCNVTLEGKPFFAREGKPYCKGHAGASR